MPPHPPRTGIPRLFGQGAAAPWLALLLIRITETTTGATWTTVRRELDRLHLGTFTGPTGLFRQVTTLTEPQTDLLAKLGIPARKQIIALEPAPR
ncbi:hypothetical protein ACFYSB_19685 [Streptomyces prasinus]|uniref:hypothetical protein n=1 Tax=Streptomyces prasinus TaxID=67345 RepID=UPI0036B3089E